MEKPLPFIFAFFLSVAINPKLAGSEENDLFQLSLDDLMSITVTSVSRRSQELSKVASSVFVIDQDLINRSGVKTLADALGLAPGVDVNQFFGDSYSVSIRGFQGQFTNKLLVLIDGKSIYTPIYGGVNWELENIPLAEIERIEVIRGAGGSVWGVNAMNGVINVITKTPQSEDGTRVAFEAGSKSRFRGYASTSGSFGSKGNFRLSTQQTYDEVLEGSDYDNRNDTDPRTRNARLRAAWNIDRWDFDLYGGIKHYESTFDSFSNTLAINPLGGLHSRQIIENDLLMLKSKYNHLDTAESVFQIYPKSCK